MIRCASAEIIRASHEIPRAVKPSISVSSTLGSTTTPLPMTGTQPGVSTPDGMRCRANFRPSGRTTVCPALLPPWYRTTYSTRPPSRSVTLPLPSSPHWQPMSTIAGMSPSHGAPKTRIPRDVRLTRNPMSGGDPVPQVVLLSLAGRGCAADETPRVPVLTCADVLRAGNAGVEIVTAGDDAEIDAAVKPVSSGDARLVVAASSDAEVRAVVRRLVRKFAPPPSKRPAELPAGRTVFDLPALAILPLAPGVPDLVRTLGLPSNGEAVAQAVLAAKATRFDLLRNDAGSVTLHGSMLGGDTAWRGRIEVDDAVLSDGTEHVLGCSIRNAGSSDVDGLPMVSDADPDDAVLDVAVAVPIVRRRLLRESS